MRNHVGIWIDHHKAVIVEDSSDHAATIESGLPAHTHFSARAGTPTGDGLQENRGERRYEAHNRQDLDRYYDDVIARIGQPESLLIFGPGEAKLQLKERLGHTKALAHVAVDLETADKLTDPQVVAQVKAHYSKH